MYRLPVIGTRTVSWPGRMAARLAALAADVVAALVAMALALRLGTWLLGGEQAGDSANVVTLLRISVPVWALLFFLHRTHRTGVARAAAAGAVALAAVAYLLRLEVGRTWLLVLPAAVVAVVSAKRAVGRWLLSVLHGHGWLVRRVVIVGGEGEADHLRASLREETALGYRVVGSVDVGDQYGYLIDTRRALGAVDRVLQAVRDADANSVIVATDAIHPATSTRLTRQLTSAGIRVEVLQPATNGGPRPNGRAAGRLPLPDFQPRTRPRWQVGCKRAIDVSLGTAVLVLSAPLLALAALVVKLGSRGPVLAREQRVGLGARPFELLRFRTSVPREDRAEEPTALVSAVADATPLTRTGRVLRATGVEELPQLWNVVRGDMSLVGPRPAAPDDVKVWPPALHEVLRMRPGVTGTWRVGRPMRGPMFDHVRFDLPYVSSWTLRSDLGVLGRTVGAVFTGAGRTRPDGRERRATTICSLDEEGRDG